MKAKVKGISSLILCIFVWAASSLAAQASVHVVKVQAYQEKLVSISESTAHLKLNIETAQQRYELVSSGLFNLPQYFVLKSGASPKTFTFYINKKYSESAELRYEFQVSQLKTLNQIPTHDALSLSILSLEERAELLLPLHCQINSVSDRMENQITLSALEALWLLERYHDMIDYFEDSCVLQNNTQNLQANLLRSYLALAHLELSNFQPAMQLFESVINWYEKNQSSTASVRARQDMATHFGLVATIYGRITKSIDLLSKGRAALEEAHEYFLNNGYEFSTIYTLAHLWSVYSSEKKYQQAISALFLSNRTIDSIAPDLLEQKISNLNHLSITYMFSGDTSTALDTMRRAINLGNHGQLNHSLSSIYLNLGSQYLQIGDFDLAKKYYLSIKKFIDTHRSDYSKGNINDGLALVAIRSKHYEEAGEYLEKAIGYFDKNPARLAKIQNRLGYLATLKGDYKQAGGYFTAAGEYYEADDVNTKNLRYYIRLARFHIDQKHSAIAAQIIQRIETYLQTLPDVPYMPRGTKSLLLSRQIDYLELKVDLFRLQGDVLQQRDHLEQLNQIIRTVSAGLDTARAGPVWADYTSRIVTKYNETLFQAYRRSGDDIWLENLFTALETHMAYSARRQRSLAQHTDNQKGEHNFLQSLYLSQVEEAENALFNAVDESAKMEAQLALNEAREKFRLSSSPFRKTEFELPSVPTLAQTQNMLKSNEVALRFFELGGAMYRFVISSDFWRVEEVGLTTQKARTLVGQLDPDKLNIRDRRLQELAVLIPADIVANDSFDKLIIVNSGPSYYVPYAALNMATQGTGYQPLMQRFSLVLPFHLGSYLLGDNASDDNTLDIIDPSITIFADPVFEGDSQTSVTEAIESNETKRNWLSNIKSLPATRQEASAIGKILKNWNVNPLLSKEATHHALLSQRSRSSTILHIASHGYFNEQTPDVIGVATSALDSNNKPLPGFLSLRSMLAVPFTSKLIVVSGCETGMGKELKGEGLVSLARGLIGQGAGGVISTLWEIPDRPTALFMRFFYEGLVRKEGDIPAALAHAQSKLMGTGRYKSPRYWAGFTYTGGSRGSSVIAI